MKKCFSFIMVTVFLAALCMSFCLAEEMQTSISPRYSFTSLISASLTFSGGTANCGGIVTPSGAYNSSITVTLYRQNGSSWDYVTSWYGSASGGSSAGAGGSVYVGSGTFKVTAKGVIGNGLERPTTSVIRSN